MNILFLSIIIIAQIVEFFNHFFIFRPTKVNKNHFLICDIMNKDFYKKLLYGQNLSFTAEIAAQLRIRETAPYFLFLLARMTVTTNSEMMTTALIDTIQTVAALVLMPSSTTSPSSSVGFSEAVIDEAFAA